MLTDKLDKSPEIRARFDKFIKTFYQRFGEKKGVKIYEPRVKFYGFGHFYVNEEEADSPTAEMGHTATPENEELLVSETYEASRLPMEINLNQIYLLNHGSLGMDTFYPRDPDKFGGFSVSFDKLTETMAHELAHALQNIINIDKGRKSLKEDQALFSQCASSGEREGGRPDGKLLHPD
ncbi:14122_t:CDS:1 [Funneliformis geosporum]|nr:14122_t:CDS:1 [Funneliformis geosporum]